jgi:hypothetical protein
MGFLKLLQGIGDRIGILETVRAPGTERGERIKTRIVTLEELACEIRSVEVRALADEPGEVSSPPERIFETAGIPPNPKGWSVDKLQEFIQMESEKGKPKEEIRRSVLAAMNSDGVTAGDIVKDAVARDRALDAFEESAQARMLERVAAGKRRVLDLEAQVEKAHQEIAGLKEKLQAQEQQWSEWRRQKRAYEKEMATAVSYIVDHPVITTDDSAAADAAGTIPDPGP